ncbi:accessory Sec system translocase SecA2 [Jiangella ureilytica]|uniref:Protein translocase subunit SecA n=1 Tax=Jiangella ureilytica TaxID=2530374 RepID=A0A4R4RQX3_9ACTN|nr:accessory Sec system translocase SecA2 [Jiangella ureilytica]
MGVRPLVPDAAARRAVHRAAQAEAALADVPDDELVTRLRADRDDALALVRELGRRALGERAHDNQLLAVVGLLAGRIVQLDTGEGKTLAGALAATLSSVRDRHVTVLAANDYLARRDATWMRPLYDAAGVSVAWVDAASDPEARRAAYAADVTYVPASELGFDELRDRLARDPEERVRGRREVVIVDEADSVLIDQARQPLVLAGAVDDAESDTAMAGLVASMRAGVHYAVTDDGYGVALTPAGEELVEQAFDVDLYSEADGGRILTRANLAVHAEALLTRDVDYIVRDGAVQLVDVTKGRVARLHRWPDGLQAAVEAKEGLVPSRAGEILDSITAAELVQEFGLLCGMTGTAASAAEQFDRMYRLRVETIPPNVPGIRTDEPLALYATRADKLNAVVDRIAAAHATGRPVLVGTPSVADSEELAGLLAGADVPCVVLNAKNHEAEAAVIAEAGRRGAVTVSTQLAGRGVDIRLGGSDGADARADVAGLGGLLVIGTEPHAAARLDDQLRGRAGRQGDPGGSVFFASLDDDLIARHARIRATPAADGRITSAGAVAQAAHAQRVAEGTALRIYANTHEYAVVPRRQRAHVLARREELLALPEPERGARLSFLDRAWADHLAHLAHLRDATPLRSLSGKAPVVEFNAEAVRAFESLLQSAEDDADEFLAAHPDLSDADAEGLGLGRPSATWTYVVRDDPYGSPVERFLLGITRRALGRPDGDERGLTG